MARPLDNPDGFLALALERKGWSFRAAAIAWGCSVDLLYKINAGERRISAPIARAMIRTTDLEWEDLEDHL